MKTIKVYGSLNRTQQRELTIPIANIVLWSESRYGAFSCEIILINGDLILTQTPLIVIENRIEEAKDGR